LGAIPSCLARPNNAGIGEWCLPYATLVFRDKVSPVMMAISPQVLPSISHLFLPCKCEQKDKSNLRKSSFLKEEDEKKEPKTMTPMVTGTILEIRKETVKEDSN
jgi:hypothetical protein